MIWGKIRFQQYVVQYLGNVHLHTNAQYDLWQGLNVKPVLRVNTEHTHTHTHSEASLTRSALIKMPASFYLVVSNTFFSAVSASVLD